MRAGVSQLLVGPSEAKSDVVARRSAPVRRGLESVQVDEGQEASAGEATAVVEYRHLIAANTVIVADDCAHIRVSMPSKLWV